MVPVPRALTANAMLTSPFHLHQPMRQESNPLSQRVSEPLRCRREPPSPYPPQSSHSLTPSPPPPPLPHSRAAQSRVSLTGALHLSVSPANLLPCPSLPLSTSLFHLIRTLSQLLFLLCFPTFPQGSFLPLAFTSSPDVHEELKGTFNLRTDTLLHHP